MLVVNTEHIPGYVVSEVKGLVQGNTVRTKHLGLGASLKSMVGEEIRSFTEMMTEARQEALIRVHAEAEAIGANAVVNLRFATADAVGAGAEILAYGTAVVCSPNP